MNLTGNETTKQFKKLSIKVIIAIILIFAFALPILVNYISNKEPNYMMESYNHNLNYIESKISELSKQDSPENKNQIAFLEAQKESVKLSIDNNIKFEEWKRNESDSFLEDSNKIVVINSILEGVSQKIIMENVVNNFQSTDSNNVSDFFTLSKEKLKAEKNALIKEKEEIKKSLASNNYIGYIEKSIKKSNDGIEKLNKQISETEKKLKSKDDKKLTVELDSLKSSLELQKSLLKVDEYRLKNRVPYEDKDWRSKTLDTIKNSTQELSTPMLSEEEYIKESQGYNSIGKTYEDYKDIYMENKVKNQDSIKLSWHSLNSNIPQIGFDDSARTSVDNIYNVFVMISAMFAIIIAGGIVSTEFSKGTVRLLLIRPVSRYKILLSKLLSVFLIGYAVMFLSIIVLTISSGFVYGFDSLSTSVLRISGGSVVETGFFIYLIPKMLFTSISLIFVVSLAFMVSTVAKNTALSVGLSSILLLGSIPISMILGNFKVGYLAKIVIGYVNLPLVTLMTGFVETLKVQFGVSLNMNQGAIQLAVLSVVFIVISFISFTKSDVKN